VAQMAHQVVTKNVAKTEFILGVASLIVDAIAIEQYQHVHEKMAEIIICLETMRAFLRTSEVEAQVNRWGVMQPAWPPLDAARNVYTRMYPRMVEILQQLGASGFMAIPSERDLGGPQAEAIHTYYQAARADAASRIKLFRLAWDIAISAFGSRQILYERFFFGDPVRMAGRTIPGDRYTIHVDIPGLVRLFVDPPDVRIWLVGSDPAAFLRFVRSKPLPCQPAAAKRCESSSMRVNSFGTSSSTTSAAAHASGFPLCVCV